MTTQTTKNTAAQTPTKPMVDNIPLTQIKVDPSKNSRTVMDEEAVKELAATMKREGQLQAIQVEQTGANEFSLVFGYRRYAAATLLGWTTIRAEISPPMQPAARAVANLAENMGRENLTTFDQGMAFYKLQKEFEMTGTSIAHSIGKSVAYVNNLIRIVEGLDPVVLQRWKEECTPNFGKDPGTGKRLPNIHSVCSTDFLGRLVAKVPRAEQERELKIALGLINPDDDGGDGDGNDAGDQGGSQVGNATRRATLKQLNQALEAAEKRVKETKGEEQNTARTVVTTLKFALGKSQSIKPIGFTLPKPGEGDDSEKKEKESNKKK